MTAVSELVHGNGNDLIGLQPRLISPLASHLPPSSLRCGARKIMANAVIKISIIQYSKYTVSMTDSGCSKKSLT